MRNTLLLFLISTTSLAYAPKELCRLIAAEANDYSARTHEVLERFADLSEIYHPSSGEKALGDYIEGLARDLGLETFRDAEGNLLVRIPGNGEPALVLQAHLDMVDAVRDLLPNEDKAAYFGKGTRWAVTDGELHSENFKATIGADNGLGVAILLSYMRESRAGKRGLELLFTTGEEIGLQGVQRIKLPVTGSQLISLDGENLHELSEGAMGAKMIQTSFSLPTTPAKDSVRYDFSLAGLEGGHSGGKIHLRGGNAVALSAAALKALQAKGFSVSLVSWEAGDLRPGQQPLFNMIPLSARFSVSIPSAEQAAFATAVKEVETSLRASLITEEQTAFTLSAQKTEEAIAPTLSADGLNRLLDGVLGIPTSVVQEKEGYPNRVLVASNLSFINVQTGKVTFGVMPRSFDNAQLAVLHEDFLARSRAIASDAQFQQWADYPAWDRTPNSGLTRSFIAFASPRIPYEAGLAGGGLEAGLLMSHYPCLKEAIVVGPTIEDVHKHKERFSLRDLDTFLEVLVGYIN